MAKTINLDERHYQLVAEKARASGQTPEDYLHRLIEADAGSFDEILAPIRRGFEKMIDVELDGLLERARKAARSHAAG